MDYMGALQGFSYRRFVQARYLDPNTIKGAHNIHRKALRLFTIYPDYGNL